MSQAALLFAALGAALGLWPMLPRSSTAGLIGAAFGFLPSLGALMLALAVARLLPAAAQPLQAPTAPLRLRQRRFP